jgi:hypothetical protein
MDANELREYQRECVTIRPHEMADECVRLPTDMALWSERYAQALERTLSADSATKTAYTRAYEALLMSEDRSGKPMPDGKAKELAKRDRDYVIAAMDEVEALGEKARVWGILEAIRAKRDMLIELGATRRREMEMHQAPGFGEEIET